MSEAKPQEEKKKEEEEEEEENLGSLLTSSISAAHEFLLRHDTATLSPKLSLAIESLLSSSALSLRRLPLPHPRRHLHRHVTTLIERLLLSSPESSPLWPHTLRLSRNSFNLLLRRLPPALSQSPNAVAAALFRLAHAAPYSSLRRRFSLQSSAEAARAFFSLLKAVPDCLPPSPSHSSSPSPRCLVIRRLPSGILVQALVESGTGKFCDVSAGWPGSLSPDAVLRQTRLFLSFEDSADSSVVDFTTRFVLGDRCFPLLPWLLTPYSGDGGGDDSAKLAFDEFHAGAMSKVRGVFRGVRKRWRILDRAWKGECAEYLPFVVVACCLLHNFAVECGEPLRVEEEEEGLSDEEEEFKDYDGERSESGERARDAVAADLARQCLQR